MYFDDTATSLSSDEIEGIYTVVNAELACQERWLQSNKLFLQYLQNTSHDNWFCSKIRANEENIRYHLLSS